MTSSWSFVVVAAGRGSRLGGLPKQLRPLGGRPLWAWSVETARTLWKEGRLRECVLVVPGDLAETPAFRDLPRPGEGDLPLRIVPGGELRGDSVLAGLDVCTGDWVLIHDAARPFLSPALCRNLMAAAEETGAAVPVLPCADALKAVDPATGAILGPVDRGGLRRTQTPQAFPRLPLLRVLREAGGEVLDEAQAWLDAGRPLTPVEGDPKTFKITDAWDWEVAVQMAEKTQSHRCGHGFDVHPLVPGRPLILGGVLLEGAPLGLDGHSDADVVCHAVADALLGAAGEPDIGLLFPATEERYRGADSLELLRQVVARVQGKGEIQWVDVTLQAQIPRLKPHLERIRANLEGVFAPRDGDVFPGQDRRIVNLKVKSGESVGSVGRGECMVCHAIATLVLDSR